MKRVFIVLFSAVMFFIFVGCGTDGSTGQNEVGSNLVSAKVLDDINASTILDLVKDKINPNATNAFAYKAIKITYKTTNGKGESINASGLLVLPTPTDAYKEYLSSQGKSFSISAICDNHGTIFLDSEAPTNVEKNSHLYPLALLTTGYAGFALIAPDYVGYGDSKGEEHPYILKKSAQASLDMIRASIRYMIDNGYAYNGQLFISGYSEGGYVAMALAKQIEEDCNGEFNLKGVTPMAGPYNIEALGAYELNASLKMVYPAFLAFIADSYSKEYDDINIDNLVVRPDVFKNYDLFGGDYNAIQIHSLLGLADVENGDYGFNTHYANELFKDDFIDDYHNNYNNPVRVRFEENSVYDWAPLSKMNLIHCLDDEIIPYQLSTQIAYDAFIENGAENITLTPIPTDQIPPATAEAPFVHQRCASVAYGLAIQWFDKLRSGE